MSGYSWRGRRLDWDPDRQALELERQRWVYENINSINRTITELIRGPEELYRLHREEYERTGRLTELHLMLEYVTV